MAEGRRLCLGVSEHFAAAPVQKVGRLLFPLLCYPAERAARGPLVPSSLPASIPACPWHHTQRQRFPFLGAFKSRWSKTLVWALCWVNWCVAGSQGTGSSGSRSVLGPPWRRHHWPWQGRPRGCSAIGRSCIAWKGNIGCGSPFFLACACFRLRESDLLGSALPGRCRKAWLSLG